MDRSAPASMKNAANCVNQCELQDTLIIDVSNAHGGLGSLPGPRPVEGRFLSKHKFAMSLAGLSRLGWFPDLSSRRESGAGSESAKTWRACSGRGFFPSLRRGLEAVGPSSCRSSVYMGPRCLAWFLSVWAARRPLLLDLNSDEMTP